MADKYNNNSNNQHDDINEFFSQFDQEPTQQTRHASDNTASASARSRSNKNSGMRSNTNKRTVSKPQPKRRRSSSSGTNNNGKGSSRKSSILSIIGLGLLGIILAVGIYVGIVFVTAPKVNTDDIYSMLAQRSVMYDSQGNEIENLYFSDGNRTVVDYNEIPEDMVNAVISIEDKNSGHIMASTS